MTSQINRTTRLVSDNGGTLDYVSAEGEILMSVHVPAGIHQAARYLDLVPEGAELQVSDGLVAVKRPHRIGIQPYGEGFNASGANPDYQPTSADRAARELRLLIDKAKARDKRLDARMRALEAIERIPQAPPKVEAAPSQPEEEIRDPAETTSEGTEVEKGAE